MVSGEEMQLFYYDENDSKLFPYEMTIASTFNELKMSLRFDTIVIQRLINSIFVKLNLMLMQKIEWLFVFILSGELQLELFIKTIDLIWKVPLTFFYSLLS